MPRVLLEACVTRVAEARSAVRNGADRLELCTRLDVGGLTPRLRLVRAVVEDAGRKGVPVFAMVRPRPGGFHLRPGDRHRVADRIRALQESGVEGIVLGFLTAEGKVDEEAVADFVRVAHPLPVTFHRAFDAAVDLDAAYEALTRCGVRRILTGGGPGRAWEGRDTLGRLVRRSAEASGPTILGAGGIRADHLAQLLAATGLREVHARATAFPALSQLREDGFPPPFAAT